MDSGQFIRVCCVKGCGCTCPHARKQISILSFALQFGEESIRGAKEHNVANYEEQKFWD
jgi:hypothetical protein